MQALLDADTRRDQPQPLADVRAILHCAARVHVIQDAAANPVVEYRRVNVDLGKDAAVERLLGSLAVDSADTRGAGLVASLTPCKLGWQPRRSGTAAGRARIKF